MGLVVVTPPATEPVSVDEVKAQLRVDYAEEDGLIAAYISSARETLERLMWQAFITQTLALTLDAWPAGDVIRLPRPPLQAVSAVTYITQDDVEHTLDPGAYIVDITTKPGRVVLRSGHSWPSASLRSAAAVKVTYTAGYGDAADAVPEPIRLAIRLLAAHWYEHREAVSEAKTLTELPLGVWWLVAPLRSAEVG